MVLAYYFKATKIRLTLAVLTICFLAIPTSEFRQQELIIWNVGQGQWITYSSATKCIHFDSGGEHFDKVKILTSCQSKRNIFLLSHGDWDHMSFLAWASHHLARPCLGLAPLLNLSSHKLKIIKAIKKCPSLPARIQNLSNQLIRFRDKNSNSNVVVLNRQWLIPGDSTSKAEKFWSRQINALKKVKYLVLGHHGSRTSTSELLLERLPHLRIAFASARKAVYGHPHEAVKFRLHRHHIPLVTTEDWGNIHIKF